MVFRHQNRKWQTYYLHRTIRTLRDGRGQPLDYFGKDVDGALDAVPNGCEVAEVSSSGLPVPKKAAAR